MKKFLASLPLLLATAFAQAAGGADIAAGINHTCAVTSSGGVKCWGLNSDGQLGDGSQTNRSTPVDVAGLENAVAVAASNAATCALTAQGGVKCWGQNAYGQLGDGTTTSRTTPVDVVGIGPGTTAGRVASIAASGNGSTCALTAAGAALCWGNNNEGGLGSGNLANSRTPVAVSGLGAGTVAMLVSDNGRTCAVTTSNQITCWGGFRNGNCRSMMICSFLFPRWYAEPLYVDAHPQALSIAMAHNRVCAVTGGPSTRCWDYSDNGGSLPINMPAVELAAPEAGLVAMAGGGRHRCQVMADGGAMCIGRNDFGQLGDNSGLDQGTLVAVAGLGSGVRAIATGDNHSCAMANGGEVWCWGSNSYGQAGGAASLPVPTKLFDAADSTPVCAPTAEPATILAGKTSTLTAGCSPLSSHVWGGAGLAGTGGKVAPIYTTTYTVRGANKLGEGATASVTVTVTDSAVFSGNRGGYTVSQTASGYSVTDNLGTGGTQSFTALKRLRFADVSLALDTDGVAGQAYRLYQAAFNRVPDLGGLGYQMSAIEVSGLSLRDVAQNFINSPEFKSTYGVLDNTQFVAALYANLLQRAPEPGGQAFYLNGLESGSFTRAMVLAGISESPENKGLVLPAIQNGILYQPLYDSYGNGN